LFILCAGNFVKESCQKNNNIFADAIRQSPGQSFISVLSFSSLAFQSIFRPGTTGVTEAAHSKSVPGETGFCLLDGCLCRSPLAPKLKWQKKWKAKGKSQRKTMEEKGEKPAGVSE
jgi:hypothetical protein